MLFLPKSIRKIIVKMDFLTPPDIVAQGGLEWIKVSSITENRILWDLTKAGWGADSSSEESDDSEGGGDLDREGLLKQIEALVKAAKASRVRYQHPKIRLVLPKIKAQPDAKEVANVLGQIRNMGVTIQTAEDMPPQYPAVADVLDRLISSPYEAFSEKLNIDCTILLSFVSDLSRRCWGEILFLILNYLIIIS